MKRFNRMMCFTCFLLASVLCSLVSNAKDMTKSEIISSKWESGFGFGKTSIHYALGAVNYYNPDLTIKDTRFELLARNDEYRHLEERFTVVSGSAQDLYNFIKYMMLFTEVCKIENLSVPVEELANPFTVEYVKLLSDSYRIDVGSSYHYFSKKDFKKMYKDLLKYCKKNNINIDTTVEVHINPALGKK